MRPAFFAPKFEIYFSNLPFIILLANKKGEFKICPRKNKAGAATLATPCGSNTPHVAHIC
jgi:hypothetical protein